MPQNFLLELVQQRLDGFCEDKRHQLLEISSDLEPIIDYTQSLLSGGKRFRALFCFWSWAGYQPEEVTQDSINIDSPIVGVAAAL
ncbi:MAG: polyprenyl synthetase family protein, partial [Aquiluna sp.]